MFASSALTMTKLEWQSDGLQLFLPCNINGYFNLVAVWTKRANSPNFGYIGQLWKYLQLHKERIAMAPSLICGDFNSNARWDEWDRWSNHTDVVRELNIGIHSAYHRLTKEGQGQESLPTLYMHRNVEKPYHIDYAFASEGLIGDDCTVEVGRREMWLDHSDHMPLISSLTMPS